MSPMNTLTRWILALVVLVLWAMLTCWMDGLK